VGVADHAGLQGLQGREEGKVTRAAISSSRKAGPVQLGHCNRRAQGLGGRAVLAAMACAGCCACEAVTQCSYWWEKESVAAVWHAHTIQGVLLLGRGLYEE
jgi:hypothetical protein